MRERTRRSWWWPVLVGGLACGGGDGGDPCSGVGCSSRGFCVADQGQAYCACIAGYHPVLRACEPNDPANPCLGIDCFGHGTCRIAADGPTCDCAAGYRTLAGSACTDRECDLVCVPVVPTDGGPCVPEGAERCDGRDNDCDGLTDEDFDLDFERANCGGCGVACTDASHGSGTCVLGDCEMICEPGWSDLDGNPGNGCEAVCVPGSTDEAVCDGRDDDCDGTTDEEWLSADTCGFGLCRRSSICHDGGVVCRPRMPPAATDATCDGLDDDCDGTIDEDCGTDADADADADADGDADAPADGDTDAHGEADGEVPSFCGNGVVEPREECDDGNEVSGDGCEPAACVFSCHDGEECRETPVDNPCTTDTCDEVAGGRLCGQVPNPRASCDDGLFCTGTDTCNASGTCISSGDPCSPGTETCNESLDRCDPICLLGASVGGGIVFYSGSECYVGAPNDQSTNIAWGCCCTSIEGGDGTSIGTGRQNTADIVNHCASTGNAAHLCDDLGLGGFIDWYLPSIYELDAMRTSGYFTFLSQYYWSSSEYDDNESWSLQMDSGAYNRGGKNSTVPVRCIRSF